MDVSLGRGAKGLFFFGGVFFLVWISINIQKRGEREEGIRREKEEMRRVRVNEKKREFELG